MAPVLGCRLISESEDGNMDDESDGDFESDDAVDSDWNSEDPPEESVRINLL